MRATLQGEVEAFLRQAGPARATDIARAIRARRSDVDEVLASGGFARVGRPEGGDTQAIYFGLSRRVPRAQRMLDVLRDGEPHSRAELLAGGVDHTNNAATELRADGYDVRFSRRAGGCYWIESFPPDEALSERDHGHGASSPPSSASAGTGRQPKRLSRSLNAPEGVAA